MQSVIVEAGVSAGGIYSHFQSKDEIVAAVGARRHQLDAKLFEGLPEGNPAGALEEVARRFIVDLLTPGGRLRRQVAVQLWAEALRDDSVREQVVAGVTAPSDRIAALLHQAGSGADARLAALTIVGIFHGFVLQHVWGLPIDKRAAMRVFARIIRGLLA